MERILLAMMAFMVLAASTSAQRLRVGEQSSGMVRVTGRVTAFSPSSGGAGGGPKPVSDVIVKLVKGYGSAGEARECGSKTLAFTSTNSKGEYVLELKSMPSGEVTLQFTHISYEKESLPLPPPKEGGKPIVQDMVLTPKNMQLKEVTVKPDPLRQKGDTLSHNLASFLGKGDVTLEDGLKRLPGVDVAQSGAISYMGKPISQFNIEGLDMLGGKYNLATRNIPADYVTQVEIVRNHHSRKVEKDIPSDEVSMNIRLAKKAKLKPFGQEEIGVGMASPNPSEGGENDATDNAPLLRRGWGRFLLGATGMMFTDKFQTICSLKGGNYKSFARADMIDHFGGSDVTTPATSLFGGFDGGAPPQGEYLYQRNGMATLNGIQKLDSATTVKVNADYSYHRATHDISQSSTYLAAPTPQPNGSSPLAGAQYGDYVTVSEQTSPLSKVHLPKLTMNYLKNADRVYLSETFVVKGKFEQNEGDVVANQQLVEQRRKTSSFEVAGDLFWMGRTEKGTRRHVNASVSFKRTPTLRLSFVDNGQGYGQTAQSSTLSMNVGSSFNIPIGKVFRLSLPVRVSAMYDKIKTWRASPSPSQGGDVWLDIATGEAPESCNPTSPPLEGLGEALYGWSFTPSVNPGFEIHSRNRRFYLSAGLGAALKGLYYNKLNYTKPVLNPSMGINYTFSANSKLQFSTGYTTQIGDMMTLLTEPMQVDYRSVRTSSGIIGESNTWHTSGDWKWQLPMQYFMLSLSAGHTENKSNTLNSQSVSGIDVSSSALQRDTRSRSTNFSVSSTKNFPSIFTKFSVEGSYSFGSSEQAVNEQVIKIKNNSYNLHGNASVTPVQWLELRCDVRYSWEKASPSPSKGGDVELHDSNASPTAISNQTSPPSEGLGEALSLHVFPIATLDLSLDYDHVCRQLPASIGGSQEGAQYKRMSLFNASAQYKWKQCVLRLELSNLLNQRSYAYTIFDGINTYCYDFGLCGRTALLRATLKL